MKEKFYDLKAILSKNADYNIIFGERSNGKTYAVLKRIIKMYAENDIQGAIIRRWADDFKGKRGASMFDALVANNEVTRATNGEWSDVYYFSGRWYMCKYDQNGTRTTDDKPFCYGFALTGMEHDKGTSYPGVGNVLFDEFITRQAYLPDEFVLFANVISTLFRHKDKIGDIPKKIFMCGNTVNKYACPYYSEMGLTHIKEMQPGTIDVYTYGDSKLTVAVEYVKPNKHGKETDKFFAFDNPKLHMITGGAWEIDIYPKSPCKIKPKDILLKYYIKFDGEILEADVCLIGTKAFTFIHRKTTELLDRDDDIIFTTEFDPRPNYYRNIIRPINALSDRLADFFRADKIFYDSNETGEIMRNYLIWCGKEGG